MKLPWPSDAVMIVAANKGRQRKEDMQGELPCMCRHCHAHLVADTRTVDTARNLPERRGRPIRYFCVDCANLHEQGQMDLLVDHRRKRNDYYRKVV